MDQKKDGDVSPGSSPVALRAPSDDPGKVNKKAQRFSARRKVEIVLRLLRDEDLELLYRERGVTAARLTKWREQFLQSGQTALKKTLIGRQGLRNRPAPAVAGRSNHG
jgi:hypothetical protein